MNLTERQKLLLEAASDWIQNNYPEACLAGVAWWFFDCGCMAGMGFSVEAGIATPVVRVDRSLAEDGEITPCEKCSGDNPADANRVFTFGTAWFRPIPDSQTRDRVKKELFSPLLERETVEMYQEGEFQITH